MGKRLKRLGGSFVPEGSQGLLKLVLVERLVAVEVHAVEHDLEGPNAHAALLLNGELEL